jgi:hypothetical protein
MKDGRKTSETADKPLNGNVMLGKKATLRQYENVTVNLMIEFPLNKSDHVTEAKKLMDAVDEIIQLAKRRWS